MRRPFTSRNFFAAKGSTLISSVMERLLCGILARRTLADRGHGLAGDPHLDKNPCLPSINGEPSWTLPMSARYVVASDGVIAYAEVNPDYTRRPDPSELFPTLDRLTRSQAASPRHPRSRRRNGVEIDDG
jgi:hypothetical protein